MRSRMGAAPAAARTNGLLVEHVGDETVIYDLDSKEAHCLNALAAQIFALTDGRRKVSELAELATRNLNTVVSEDEVAEAVAQLEERRLLDSPVFVQQSGISRRDALRRGVFATVLITTIGVPVATAAATAPIPTGCTGCGQNKDCASNHCCQDVAGKSCNQTCCVGENNSCHRSATGDCTVLVTDTGCGTCPCADCPNGSSSCCSNQ